MLGQISWSQYLTGIFILLFIYYIIIGLRFYRKELSALFSGRKLDPKRAKEKELHDQTFLELEMLTDEIRYRIFDKAGKEADKVQLLQQLKASVASFSGLSTPAFRYALNNFIIHYGKEKCGVTFSEEELDAEWEVLPR